MFDEHLTWGLSETSLQRRRKSTKTQSIFLTGRLIAWMILGHFKIRDKDGTALNNKGENVQLLDTKWDETIIAMQKHP